VERASTARRSREARRCTLAKLSGPADRRGRVFLHRQRCALRDAAARAAYNHVHRVTANTH